MTDLPPSSQASRVTILVVDDRPANLLAMKRILATLAVEVITALSGNDALTCVIRQGVDLVLLDVQMPGMDGFEVAALMKGDERFRNIPIIFVTAINKEDSNVYNGYEVGAVDYIFKPIEPELLLRKVRVFLLLAKQTKQLVIRNEQLVLAKERAEAAQVRLERSNADIQHFAHVASHDLKTPLRGVRAIVDWLKEDLAEVTVPSALGHLSQLESRVTRMEALLDGILKYSDLDRARRAAVSVDVGRLLNDICEQVIAPDSDFSVEVLGEMPTLRTNPALLEQVFSNLLSNAVKHHDRQSGVVRVSCTARGEFFEFSVCDDGPGIEACYHEKVFQIFQTLGGGDVERSVGIGLSLVRKLVLNQGGELRLQSGPDRGSVFLFTWPST